MKDIELNVGSAESATGRYAVLVADNFQYMDSGQHFELGTYATLDEAIEASMGVVTHWLTDEWKPGMTAEQLYGQYVSFGEDPFIIDGQPPDDPEAEIVRLFSAWEFAKRMAPVIVAVKSAAHR